MLAFTAYDKSYSLLSDFVTPPPSLRGGQDRERLDCES